MSLGSVVFAPANARAESPTRVPIVITCAAKSGPKLVIGVDPVGRSATAHVGNKLVGAAHQAGVGGSSFALQSNGDSLHTTFVIHASMVEHLRLTTVGLVRAELTESFGKLTLDHVSVDYETGTDLELDPKMLTAFSGATCSAVGL